MTAGARRASKGTDAEAIIPTKPKTAPVTEQEALERIRFAYRQVAVGLDEINGTIGLMVAEKSHGEPVVIDGEATPESRIGWATDTLAGFQAEIDDLARRIEQAGRSDWQAELVAFYRQDRAERAEFATRRRGRLRLVTG